MSALFATICTLRALTLARRHIALFVLLLTTQSLALTLQPPEPTSPVASTRPSHGRPQRSEDGRLGGAGRAQAESRARNGVGTSKAMLAGRPANGPPSNAAAEASIAAASSEGTVDAPVTWVFEPESFAPLAKIVAGQRFGIITDHLGTPRAMFDDAGHEVWSADIDAYGDLRNLRGERLACPFRWPGQYEVAETGLYYNRFRYYDPLATSYLRQDPIGLAGGLQSYAYAVDPLIAIDPDGLSCSRAKPRIEQGNLREGWEHIDARHVSGTHPSGAGDLFATGTTRPQLEDAASKLVKKGTRISDPSKRIQTFEKRMKVNGKRDRVRVIVDSEDGNRVITIFPVRSGP